MAAIGGEIALGLLDPLGRVTLGESLGAAGDELVGSVALLGGEHGVGAGQQPGPTRPVGAAVAVGVVVGALGGGRLPQHHLDGLLAAADLGAVALAGPVSAV